MGINPLLLLLLYQCSYAAPSIVHPVRRKPKRFFVGWKYFMIFFSLELEAKRPLMYKRKILRNFLSLKNNTHMELFLPPHQKLCVFFVLDLNLIKRKTHTPWNNCYLSVRTRFRPFNRRNIFFSLARAKSSWNLINIRSDSRQRKSQ